MLALLFFAIVSAGLAITSYFEVRPTHPTTYGLPTLGGPVPTPSPLPFFNTCPRLSPIQYSSLAYTSLHGIDLTTNPSGFVFIPAEHPAQQENFPDLDHIPTPLHLEGVAHSCDLPQEYMLDHLGIFLFVAQSLVIAGLFIIRITPQVIIKYVDQTAKDVYISMLLEKLSKLARRRKERKAATDKSTADFNDQVVDLDGQVVHLNRKLRTVKCQMGQSILWAQRLERELATSEEQLATARHDLAQRDEVIARMTKEKRQADAELDSLRGDVSRMKAEAESQGNALAAEKIVLKEQLDEIMAEHQTLIADMQRKYEESLRDEERRHELIVQGKAKEIVALESIAASAKATIARLELRVEELELTELTHASPSTPPTTPPAPTTEQSDSPSTPTNATPLDLASDATPSPATAPVNAAPEPTVDLSPPVTVEKVEPATDIATASSSSQPAYRGAFSDAPRGLNASMWAPGPEDRATTPSEPSRGSNNARPQRGGSRTKKQNQKNRLYSDSTHFGTSKRRGPQTGYDAHDHRG